MATLFLVVSVSGTFGKEWKSRFGGRTIEGEFVGLKSGRLTLKKPDGTELTLPLTAMSAEDQKFAQEAQAKLDAANQVDLVGTLNERMIAIVDGKPVAFQFPKSKPSHVLFYVVSSLCDTCQDHAPKLKEYYNESLASAPEMELVVISLDDDKEEQEQFLAGHKLPFPAVAFDQMEAFEKAMPARIFNRSSDGCSTFILVTAEGKLVTKSSVTPKRAIAAILGKNSPK